MLGFLFDSRPKWLSAGDYCLLSTKEKLKYHKRRKENAEQLPYDTTLALIVDDVNRKIRSSLEFPNTFKLKSKFKIMETSSYMSQMDRTEFHKEFPNVTYELPEDSSIVLRGTKSYPFTLSIALQRSNDTENSIAFIVGSDNVIHWYDTTDIDIVLNIIEKLYKEFSQ